MENLTRDQVAVTRLKTGSVSPVERVAEQRMPERRQMHADLVRSAGLQFTAQERKAVSVPLPARNNSPMGHGVFCVRARGGQNRHFFAIHGVSADRRVHRSAVVGQIPDGDGVINATDTVSRKLCRQPEVGFVILRNNQQTACILIDAVNDSRTKDTAHAREAFAAVPQERVDKRSVRVSCGRMNHHANGFVDDDKVAVLVNHIKRDILRRRFAFLYLRLADFQPLPRAQAVILVAHLTVHGHEALANQPCGGGTRYLCGIRHRAVKPFAASHFLHRVRDKPVSLFRHHALPTFRRLFSFSRSGIPSPSTARTR